MPKNKSTRMLIFLLVLGLTALACGILGDQPPAEPTQVSEEKGQPVSSENRCGDGFCDGPENERNCPEDCDPAASTEPAGGTTASASACDLPNPHHAVISSEILEFQDWLQDGGFESGAAEVETTPSGGERLQAAARTGSWGYAIRTEPGESVVFSLKFYIEKGEDLRITFWARSPEGETSLTPAIVGVHNEDRSVPVYTESQPLSIGPDWTQIVLESDFTDGFKYALLNLAIPSDSHIHLDDIQVGFPIWKVAEYDQDTRDVGGISVPRTPVAPVHINFLIHIEDPAQITNVEAFFQQKTAVFRELARTFHEHGGFLTIQPEEDWVLAAKEFSPGLLRELADEYDVQYSTHTHGPNCRDPEGRLRSAGDCNANKETAGWDHPPQHYQYPEVVEYVGALSDLISEAAGQPVTDHNGNWYFTQAGRFAEIPVLTWSGYKNHFDQRTYDVLIVNPWRPTEVDATKNVDAFLNHDPETQIVYVPGWGQALTRHPERALPRLRPMISQFIRYADPERVNTFYAVLHVDHFISQLDDPNYLAYDPQTGNFNYSDEFRADIAHWDAVLTELIDPLVAEGYLKWTSLPEIGELFLKWETECTTR